MPISKQDSKRKSSRLKADLFEVSVALELAKKYNLFKRVRELAEEIHNLKQQLSRFGDGQLRVSEQVSRSKVITPLLKRELDQLTKVRGKIIDVDWIGRSWQKNRSLSDVDIVFRSKTKIGLSLKSTRTGTGTQKNPGYKSFKIYLGLNMDREIDSMWENIRAEMKRRNGSLAKLSTASRITIRKSKYKFKVIQTIGAKYGSRVQKLAVIRSVKLFNKLSSKNKLRYLEFLLGIEVKPLLNASVRGNTGQLYWNEKFKAIANKTLSARKESDKAYIITAGSKRILRTQINFTNGIGLSSLCGRVFLVEKIT